MNSLFQRISHWTLRYYWLILLVFLALAIAAGFIAKDLQFKGDFVDLLPSHAPSVQGLDEIKKRLGGEGYLIVVLETPNIDKAKAFAELLAPKLQSLREARYIDYKFDREFFEKRTLLYVDSEDLQTLKTRLEKKIDYEKKHLNPFYIDLLEEKYEFNVDDIKDKYLTRKGHIKEYYITENPSRLVMLLKPAGFAGDLNFCKTLLSNTQTTIASLNPGRFDPDLKIRYTGRYVSRIEEVETLFNDLKITSIFAFIGVLLLLFFITKQVSALFVIAYPLIHSLIFSVASATLIVGYLNMITSALVGILTGLGIDFAIHFYWRYVEERKKGHSIEQSLDITLSKTLFPALYSALTTAVAFYVLAFSHFSGFAQFGRIAGTGILICFLTTYILLPSVLVLREKLRPLTLKPVLVPELTDFVNISQKYPKPFLTIACFALFILYSIKAIFNIEFDYDFRKFSADKYGTLALQEEISEAFGVSLSPTIVHTDDYQRLSLLTENLHSFRDRRAGKALTDTVRRDPESKSTIHKGLSLYSFVPQKQPEKMVEIPKIAGVLKNKYLSWVEGEEAQKIDDLRLWTTATPFGIEDLPPSLKQQYNAVEGYTGSFLFIFPAIDLWDGKDVVRFANEVRDFLKENIQNHIHVASEAMIFSDILDLVKKEGPQAFALSFFAILLLLWIEFRRIKLVLLALFPLMVSILCMAGIMYPFGIKLNFLNCVVFPILLGLNIDNSIRILHRYEETGPGSLYFVIRKTGIAVFMSIVTSMIGFGGLLFAYHRGLNSIALLAIIGMGFSLIASLTLLPATLQILEDRAKKSFQKPVS